MYICDHEKQYIFLPFLSNFYSSQKPSVSLSDFDQCCFSADLLPLKPFNIIFEDFLSDFQLSALATAFPDIPFDVFVGH